MFSYILFDLDGTVSDSKPGITSCVQYALKDFGIEEPDQDKLECFIGPPLRDSFMRYYGFTPEQAEQGVQKYRERYATVGKYENVLYPGMKELLADLQAAGAHLAIASSKPEVFVEDILTFFNIRQYFEVVVGSRLDGTREKKEEVLEEVMGRLLKNGPGKPADVVMIGDRRFDIEGAKAVGAHHIGVAWGYATPGELEAAGAEIVVRSVENLRQVLLGVPGSDMVARGGKRQSLRHRPESRAVRIWKALGMCALAVGLYFMVNAVVGGLVMGVGLALTDNFRVMGVSAYGFWMNMGNAVGILAGFIACTGVWYRRLRYRPRCRVDRLSLIPMALLAAALAMGLNGLLTLSDLYRYSPSFQEVSEIQYDTPVWLGILAFGVLAPLGEETVFRGLVYGNLKKVFSFPVSMILSGLAFGIFHGNLVQGIYASLLGFVLALIYELYDTIIAPMVFHGVANLFIYVLLNLTEFGGIFLIPLSCLFMLMISGVCLVLTVRWQRGNRMTLQQ